ncbi:hypothetical protein BC936DRAFT_142903, partial [Jimgerdemannia flammicorona]
VAFSGNLNPRCASPGDDSEPSLRRQYKLAIFRFRRLFPAQRSSPSASPNMNLTFFRKNLIAVIVFVVVTVVIIAPLSQLYVTESDRYPDNVFLPPSLSDNSWKHGIDVIIKIVSVDFLTSTYRVHVNLDGYDSINSPVNETLMDQMGLFVKRPFSIFFSENTYSFDAKKPISPLDLTLNFISGDPSYYPFDTWFDQIPILAFFTNNSNEYIPVSVRAMGTIPITSINPLILYNSTTAITTVSLNMARSATTKGFSLFIIIIMWLLALGVTSVAYEIIFCGREVILPHIQPPIMAATAALLFAIVNVRNAQPGVPPIGSLADICGYFWNVALIAVSAFMMTVCWVWRWAPKPAENKQSCQTVETK